jgi:hypothetical protein
MAGPSKRVPTPLSNHDLTYFASSHLCLASLFLLGREAARSLQIPHIGPIIVEANSLRKHLSSYELLAESSRLLKLLNQRALQITGKQLQAPVRFTAPMQS